MQRGLVALLAVTGCRAVFGLDDPQLRADAALEVADAPPDVPDTCFGSAPQVCLTALPVASVALVGAIDTTTDPRCAVYTQANGPDLCVIAGTTITIGDVTATGIRPLVFVAQTQIMVQGVLDLSSHTTGSTMGAGANAACAPADGQTADQGGGGGAGGSFGTSGGDGGDAAGLGASALAPISDTSVLRGGCKGGAGGAGNAVGSGGYGGASGGAVALLTKGKIVTTSTGAVFASGAGGGRGNPMDSTQNRGAGGGGGSGGMVVFDAPEIMTDGIVAANGGGGGGGGDCCSAFTGADGSTSNYLVPAMGGQNEGGTHGGPGGAGAAGTSLALAGSSPGVGGGGGGGGGGHGLVVVRGSVPAGAQFSPAPYGQ